MPTTRAGRARSMLLWGILGAVVGFMAYYPLAIMMAGSTKAMIGLFEDWTWPVFVPLGALAFAAIPLSAALRCRGTRIEDWSRLLARSVVTALVAVPLSSILAISIFAAVRSSWEYMHDGVADWFMLSIPVTTGVAVLVSAFLGRSNAPKHGPPSSVVHGVTGPSA